MTKAIVCKYSLAGVERDGLPALVTELTEMYPKGVVEVQLTLDGRFDVAVYEFANDKEKVN